MNISGTDADENYLYNNCGRKTEKNRNGLMFEDQFYDDTVYYKLNDGHFEVIIDTTK